MMAIHKHAAAKRVYVRHPHSGLVTVSRVHAAAWAAALTLAGGDTRRLRVINATTIVVINKPKGIR